MDIGLSQSLQHHNQCHKCEQRNGEKRFFFIELAPVRNAFLVESADRDDKLLARERDYFIAVNTYKQSRQNVGILSKTESKLMMAFHQFEDIQSLMISE